MSKRKDYKIISISLNLDVLNALDAQIWDYARQRAAYAKRSAYIESILRTHLQQLGVNLNATTDTAAARDCDI